MILLDNQPEKISKPEIEQVQQEKMEYYLLGTYWRTRGLQLFCYNPTKDEVEKVEIKYSDTNVTTERLKVLDDLGEDILEDVATKNLFSQYLEQRIDALNKKREEVFLERLSEMGIEFDPIVEERRRFKRFSRSVVGNEEIIYYNDGSITGKRVITFITKEIPFDPSNFSMSQTIHYY